MVTMPSAISTPFACSHKRSTPFTQHLEVSTVRSTWRPLHVIYNITAVCKLPSSTILTNASKYRCEIKFRKHIKLVISRPIENQTKYERVSSDLQCVMNNKINNFTNLAETDKKADMINKMEAFQLPENNNYYRVY